MHCHNSEPMWRIARPDPVALPARLLPVETGLEPLRSTMRQTIRPTAHGQTRGIAMVEGAVYDAVKCDRPQLRKAITPVARHAGLDTAYTNTLAGILDGPIEAGGVAAGEAAAAAMLDFRKDDGFMATFNPTIGTDAGTGGRSGGRPRRCSIRTAGCRRRSRS